MRPTGVTLAAIYLIVMGVLTGLIGACAAGLGGVMGGAAGQAGDAGAMMGGFGALFAGLGIVILVVGILSIAAGVGALQGKNWGRWLGIAISAVVVVLTVLGLVQTGFDIQNNLLTIIIAVLYVLTAWALFTARGYFERVPG
ncbi:MAG TPA: hypothetical protein VNW68_03390 [Candidatus Limnocylindria bacterium]|jgi:hypothetical protein|nr:hypothetical protein [Candidatus Limnocylindria bacterium]